MDEAIDTTLTDADIRTDRGASSAWAAADADADDSDSDADDSDSDSDSDAGDDAG